MTILDLTGETKDLFSICLEDWSDEAKEAGPRRREWVERFLRKGLRAKLAVDDSGAIGGMIQYLPIEHSFVDGEGLCFIPCIWVHGHPRGRGNFQKQDMGKALLAAAEEDARQSGAQGMAAWGIWLPFWMKASWFKKRGYIKADRQGLAVLLWKPFTCDAKPPRWFPAAGKLPETTQGKVTVTSFVNGWCMGQNLVCERAKRASLEFGDKVVFREIDTSDRRAVAEWGISDALFVDRKQVRTGPPPTFEKIRKLIGKYVKRL